METLTTTHKVCSKCDAVKDLSEFSRDATRYDDKHPWCKDCKRTNDTASRREKRHSNESFRKRENEAGLRSYFKHREERNAKLKARGTDYIKNSVLKSVYGITLEEFDSMVEKQCGVCAICGKPETRKSRFGGICRLHVDHDHKTGKVRGLLCSNCNMVLGHAKDNIETLSLAIIYLTKKI